MKWLKVIVIAVQFAVGILFIHHPVTVLADEKEGPGRAGEGIADDAEESSLPTDGSGEADNPFLIIELGGETYYKYSPEPGDGIGGLAAIMVDLDGQLSERLTFFGAFHFDSAVWHDFLNKPAFVRKADPDYDIELEVEEFFITWKPEATNLEFTAGRMFSVVSYANQLHLADFQFNMKPRIFTEYWGDNHGLALDGGSVKWFHDTGRSRTALLVEAAKNGYQSSHTVLTTTLDFAFNVGDFDMGIRGFGYFDHQENDHPFLKYVPSSHVSVADAVELNNGLGMNAWGGGANLLWYTPGDRSVFFQTEWVNRKLANESFFGGYAFLILNHTNKISSSIMYQQLELPDFGSQMVDDTNERVYTVGLSYIPIYNHRLRLEYNHFSESSFYDNMLLAKWTFFLEL